MRDRAVRMLREHEGDHASHAAAVRCVAEKVGCHRETLRLWPRQAERDGGARPGPTSEERDRIRQLEREVRALRRPWRAEPLAPTASRGRRGRASHGREADARRGLAGCRARRADRDGRSDGACLTVGWRVSGSATAAFVLDAPEQAIHDRRPVEDAGLVARSDRGSQSLAIRCTERSPEDGIEPSIGSVGGSYDDVLAKTVIGLFKTEVIRRGPWRSLQAVEFATLEWVDGLDTRRPHEPTRNVPPAEAEAAHHDALETAAMAA